MISITQTLLFVVSSILTGMFIWAKYNFSYWRRKNIAFVKPNYIFGNFTDMLTMSKSCADVFLNLYNHKNAKDQPILGFYIFNKPALLVLDPDLIKYMLVKNFHRFSDRHAQSDTDGDTLGSGTLFLIKNPHWKELRTKLSPVFSSGKMKQMFPLIDDAGNDLDYYLSAQKLDKNSDGFVREVKEICTLYTTDVIASVAFGIKTNSLKDPEDVFRRIGQSVLDFTVFRAIKFVIVFFVPHLAKLLRCKMFSKDSERFFRASINSVMEKRIKNGKVRNDMIDVLVEFKKAAALEENEGGSLRMNNDILVAQAAMFFIAGYETAATTMAFCLYELSKRPEIQTRLRNEIRQVLLKSSDGTLNYEDVNEMEYLNMVVMETLRLYPSLPGLDRKCTLPEGEREFSLKPYCDFAVPNNMPVYVPKIAIHRDPKHFPNPEVFDPERFSDKNKPNIRPGTYIPFGIGPRSCLGYRLGLLKSKIGLINFLRNHIIVATDKSFKQMVFDPKALFITAQGGIYCKFVRDPLVTT